MLRMGLGLTMLRMALGLIGPHAVQTSIDLRAGESLAVMVTGTGPDLNGDGSGRDFSPLRDRASQAGIPVEMVPVPGGTRLAWDLPIRPRTPVSA
jgi:hypothetical protein